MKVAYLVVVVSFDYHPVFYIVTPRLTIDFPLLFVANIYSFDKYYS